MRYILLKESRLCNLVKADTAKKENKNLWNFSLARAADEESVKDRREKSFMGIMQSNLESLYGAAARMPKKTFWWTLMFAFLWKQNEAKKNSINFQTKWNLEVSQRHFIRIKKRWVASLNFSPLASHPHHFECKFKVLQLHSITFKFKFHFAPQICSDRLTLFFPRSFFPFFPYHSGRWRGENKFITQSNFLKRCGDEKMRKFFVNKRKREKAKFDLFNFKSDRGDFSSSPKKMKLTEMSMPWEASTS